MNRYGVIANAVLFQLCWIAFVAGAGRGNTWLGFAALSVFAAWQLSTSSVRRADVELMAFAALLGFGVDTAYVQAGALHFATPFPSEALAPLWIVGMWMAFALTLNHSLAFLKRSLLAAILLGLVGGPLAYAVAAGRFGAVVFDGTALFALAMIGLAWGAVTPLLSQLAARLVAREAASHA
ncbi:MAG TPA: DUF2878 domain-containing protein [Candidatus Saccharimonadia bacterium]|nr:DUF2878 domain-containing protein [Candidatus Saccharimonadia bacterium]